MAPTDESTRQLSLEEVHHLGRVQRGVDEAGAVDATGGLEGCHGRGGTLCATLGRVASEPRSCGRGEREREARVRRMPVLYIYVGANLQTWHTSPVDREVCQQIRVTREKWGTHVFGKTSVF